MHKLHPMFEKKTFDQRIVKFPSHFSKLHPMFEKKTFSQIGLKLRWKFHFFFRFMLGQETVVKKGQFAKENIKHFK